MSERVQGVVVYSDEFVVEEEEEMFIPDKEDDTWMLASTRTAPYYWLLHAITMVR